MEGRRRLSPVVISTALGLQGQGIFPYTLWPEYRRLVRLARETGTTILAKSATRQPRRGNFLTWNPLTWRYIQRLDNLGMLNAYGLTNPGAAAAVKGMRASLDQGLNVIPNLYPEFAKGTEAAIRETLEAAELYRSALGSEFWALELNFSCPNSAEEIRENVGQALRCSGVVRERFPELFLIAKLSVCHPYEFAQELERRGVNALHAVNTIPHAMVFPGKISPLADAGGGGVSGGPAFEAAFAYNRELRPRVKAFLIMGCGVTCRGDVERYRDLGADAVSLCTLALRNPAEAGHIIEHYNG